MSQDTKKIAVIGAGFTGLTAAYRLALQGYHVTVLEKEAVLGGLVAGFEMHNQPIEKVYHFLYMTDADALGLLEDLGVRDKLTFYDSSVSTYYDGTLFPFMTPKDLLTFTPLSLLDRIRTGAVAFYLQRCKNWKPLTKITAYDWMKKYAGKHATRIIWEPLLKGKFGKFYDKVTMSWLWSRIHVRANSKESGSTGEKLGYIEGSFAIVIEALERAITERGGRIITSCNIEAIDGAEGEKSKITYNGTHEEFDAILATVPTHVFDTLTAHNPLVKKAPQRDHIDYIGAIVGIFSSTQEISEYYWHNINDDSIPFLVFLSETALTGTDLFEGRHVYYIGVYVEHEHPYFDMPDKAILDEWFGGLKKMFPDFDVEQIMEKHLFKFRNAQHIVDIGYEDKMPPYKSVLPGVYLANFSQIFPDDRGINYAVQEGNKLAAMIDRDLA